MLTLVAAATAGRGLVSRRRASPAPGGAAPVVAVAAHALAAMFALTTTASFASSLPEAAMPAPAVRVVPNGAAYVVARVVRPDGGDGESGVGGGRPDSDSGDGSSANGALASPDNVAAPPCVLVTIGYEVLGTSQFSSREAQVAPAAEHVAGDASVQQEHEAMPRGADARYRGSDRDSRSRRVSEGRCACGSGSRSVVFELPGNRALEDDFAMATDDSDRGTAAVAGEVVFYAQMAMEECDRTMLDPRAVSLAGPNTRDLEPRARFYFSVGSATGEMLATMSVSATDLEPSASAHSSAATFVHAAGQGEKCSVPGGHLLGGGGDGCPGAMETQPQSVAARICANMCSGGFGYALRAMMGAAPQLIEARRSAPHWHGGNATHDSEDEGEPLPADALLLLCAILGGALLATLCALVGMIVVSNSSRAAAERTLHATSAPPTTEHITVATHSRREGSGDNEEDLIVRGGLLHMHTAVAGTFVRVDDSGADSEGAPASGTDIIDGSAYRYDYETVNAENTTLAGGENGGEGATRSQPGHVPRGCQWQRSGVRLERQQPPSSRG